MILGAVTMVPLIGLWLVMSRSPRIRWVVAAALAGITVLAVALVYLLPRAAIEVTLAAPLLGVLTMLAGRLAERGRRGRGPRGIAVLLVAWVVVSWGIVLVVSMPAAFHPAADRVLPLPDGLRATVAPHDDAACEYLSCQVRIDVTGEPAGDLRAELTRHLKARGWGDGCRPVGWLLDGSTACVELLTDGERATIVLRGYRENVREKTLTAPGDPTTR